MPDGSTTANWAENWLDAQKTFWGAALQSSGAPRPDEFAPEDWQAFDGFAAEMLRHVPTENGVDWANAYRALLAYRTVIMGTWSRVSQSFEIQRRAMQGLKDPDWRIVRDRWFQVAETEFITTLRSPEFVDAQGGVLRAALDIWSNLPDPLRTVALDAWRSNQIASETLAAFELDGVAIAQTPKDVIWAEGSTTLSRYRPLDGQVSHLGPMVICHGLIGRQTMADLQPDRSLVRNLLAAGVDVFIVDWGSATPADADLGLDHFAGLRLSQCLNAAREQAGGALPVLFGICQGGTMAACHAAIFSP